MNASTLTIVDNADGTGATATVADSAVGATNEVYVSSVNGQLQDGLWVLEASRVGDGEADLEIDPGYYFGYVRSELDDESAAGAPIYFRVSTGDDAVHKQCLDAVVARIQLLELEDLHSERVGVAMMPALPQCSEVPLIRVGPVGRERMNVRDGTNIEDDTGYPVLIAIYAASNREKHDNLEQYLKWREQIAKAFQNLSPLTGVNQVYRCEVEPLEVVDVRAYYTNLFVSGLIVRCVSREPRGLT